MTIDKSWTRIRNRNCQEFFNGLDAFLETCKDHLNTSNTCRCPCERCDNQYYASIASLRNHIHRNGFSSAYNIWRFHGEQFIIPTSREDLREPRNGLHDYLDDVRQENNTNEPNTDTDEQSVDVGNTSDELSELYKMAAESLYPGCEMSWLDFVAKLAHIKVINKWTDTSYNQTVELLITTQRRMEDVLRAQSGSENPMSEAEILTDVLGPRRSHVRGIGRKVNIKSSSTSGSCAESRPSTRMYTQSEVDAMLASQQSELDGKLKDQDVKLKAIVDAMRQAGISVNIPSTSLTSPEVDLECDDLEDSD